ncbi:efflux RND transporter periplasmic adaptor subunit [Acinetobacter qingfengensis]|uniref:Efflux transporter periplasmic adaptor subunit n=1 Tax=Acinetobacter qingfengensis TaxID=1262585 RepID=A0A1E7RFP4_9GAMM|nr:efflux RND transporter periplasmic adaptor subunit [Acinetobacter qingfengensis]KAA8731892.1 efflux RND transporter periplasmic adaptor subunit [Acinetobacter qingfengensis]OEY98209.1 efflux transporter periplasmic adaptor subunit [Acinetobacter qingfengensis]
MRSVTGWKPTLTACTLALSIALVGCGKSTDQTQQNAAAAQQAQAVPVGVIVAQAQNVDRTVELAGRTTAYEVSEVRPQTNGVILKRLFAEGSYVRKGQALYELDSRTNRATLANTRAALAQQQANLNSLRIKTNRYRQLLSTNAIAKQDYDDLVGQVRVAEAQVAAAEAQVQNAQIDLGYSTITAPISGQSGRSSVTAGALVTANQTNALVTIQQLDPIYVDINQSSNELLALRQQLSQGSLGQVNNAKVKLKLENGSIYPVEGTLAFSDANVDENTGTVTLRVVFKNPNHLLLPGMFVNAQIVQGSLPNAFLIPQVALTRTPTGQATVMVVNAKGVAESRIVETQGTQGSSWIVTKGLQNGDKVIVEGIAKVKDGAKVDAKPYQAPAQTANAQSAAQGQTSKPAQAKPEQKANSNT